MWVESNKVDGGFRCLFDGFFGSVFSLCDSERSTVVILRDPLSDGMIWVVAEVRILQLNSQQEEGIATITNKVVEWDRFISSHSRNCSLCISLFPITRFLSSPNFWISLVRSKCSFFFFLFNVVIY